MSFHMSQLPQAGAGANTAKQEYRNRYNQQNSGCIHDACFPLCSPYRNLLNLVQICRRPNLLHVLVAISDYVLRNNIRDGDGEIKESNHANQKDNARTSHQYLE
jgi:hypothetical protein